MHRKLDFLKNIYFFHSLSEPDLDQILALSVERTFDEGSVLFFEDTPGDSFFVVLKGELEVWKRYGQSDELLLNTCGVGQPVGEMALIDDQPRSATVRAKNMCTVLAIAASDFRDLIASNTRISVTLLRSVTSMVRRSNEAHIADLDRQNRELSRAYKELQAAQEELVNRERLSAIGRFSSIILHDIRNPLSAIRSRLELMTYQKDDPEYISAVIPKINQDLFRMERLAAEILDYARGEIRLQMSVCSIPALFTRLQDTLSDHLQTCGIELICNNSVTVPVILDEERILRVLINACENALKAMPAGGTLTLRSTIDDFFLSLAIEDTGQGMSQEMISRVFEPFQSFSTAGGTGLGMVIIKSVVEAHKGELELSSQEGKGTILSIKIPHNR